MAVLPKIFFRISARTNVLRSKFVHVSSFVGRIKNVQTGTDLELILGQYADFGDM